MDNFFLEPVSSFEYKSLPENAPLWVTHTKKWADVLEKTYPQIKGYIAADSRTIGPDCSFMPIYRIKRLYNRTSWLSIPYSTISDPVFNGTSSGISILKAITSHPLTHNCKIEIRALNQLQYPSDFLQKSEYLCHQLFLNKSEDEIFRSFHRTAVQVHIRKSLESGLRLKIASSLNDVMQFYQIYVKMRKELGLPPQPFAFYKNMWNELNPHNIELLIAEYEGRAVAGMWIIKNRWLYSFEYLARACKNDKMRCAHFLYWHGIKRALQSNTAVVSFSRTSSKNTGLLEFKRRWGTVELPYLDLSYPAIHCKIREEQFIFRIMKKLSPKLSSPLFQLLGEIIYRFI
jgi:hypothetical protein